jgi:integrase
MYSASRPTTRGGYSHENRTIFVNTLPPQTIVDVQAVCLELKRKGIEPTTLRTIAHCLKALSKKADLNNPLEVTDAISDYKKRNKQPASNGFKKKLCDSYQYYARHFELFWEKPHYKYEERGIQPPTTERCLQLIGAAQMPMSLKIQVSYETGLRPIEIQSHKGLRVKDFHPDTKSLTSLNTKRCNARPAIGITEELTARLKTYISENKLQPEDYIFTFGNQTFSEQFRRFKLRLAKKLSDPTIATIRLYDLRHAYITRQLRKTQNAEIVRQMVGHKTLNTTQKYLHLTIQNTGEWIVESTNDKKRAEQLLLNDFKYELTTPDGYMMFRKPK